MRAALALLVPVALLESGCSGDFECKSELATGSATFTGSAVGKVEGEALRTAAVRDACRQKCAADKAPMIDACTAACAADVSAGKLGAKTTCGRK